MGFKVRCRKERDEKKLTAILKRYSKLKKDLEQKSKKYEGYVVVDRIRFVSATSGNSTAEYVGGGITVYHAGC